MAGSFYKPVKCRLLSETPRAYHVFAENRHGFFIRVWLPKSAVSQVDALHADEVVLTVLESMIAMKALRVNR